MYDASAVTGLEYLGINVDHFISMWKKKGGGGDPSEFVRIWVSFLWEDLLRHGRQIFTKITEKRVPVLSYNARLSFFILFNVLNLDPYYGRPPGACKSKDFF